MPQLSELSSFLEVKLPGLAVIHELPSLDNQNNKFSFVRNNVDRI